MAPNFCSPFPICGTCSAVSEALGRSGLQTAYKPLWQAQHTNSCTDPLSCMVVSCPQPRASLPTQLATSYRWSWPLVSRYGGTGRSPALSVPPASTTTLLLWGASMLGPPLPTCSQESCLSRLCPTVRPSHGFTGIPPEVPNRLPSGHEHREISGRPPPPTLALARLTG